MHITFTVDEKEHQIPARWEICDRCGGNGKHSHAIGAITASEWADDWSPEEQEDYRNGRYDSICEACKGSGKVLIADKKRADPKLWALYMEHLRSEYEYQRMCESEIRFGC